MTASSFEGAPQSASQPAGVTPAPADTEWLLANGLGGYASGTAAGVPTRRYHGLLVAALPAPLGRVVMFNHLLERVSLSDKTSVELSGWDHAADVSQGSEVLRSSALEAFGLEGGLPVWRFRVGSNVVEKRVALLHRQNTVHVQFRHLSGADPLSLELRPLLQCRPHE